MTNWILCPLRNNLAFIRAALPTFLAQDIGDVRVLLLDNASTDGTAQWVGSLNDERITYVYNQHPKSVAASWNWMLEYVFGAHEQWALVVNADVELRPDTYRWLLADGGLFVTAVGTSDRAKIAPPYAPPMAAKRPNPDYSAYMIRRKCWDAVGRFDEGCEIAFCEDSLHHIKMHRMGIRAECIDLPFWHFGSATIKHSSAEEAQSISEAAQRNREYFHSKYGCYPGTKEYERLFDNESFGADA